MPHSLSTADSPPNRLVRYVTEIGLRQEAWERRIANMM
jgi:hypothetical protein